MIIPKKHLSGFLDVHEDLMTEFVRLSRHVIKILQKAFGSESFDWTIQDGKAAGQTIDHMHMHIIPRISGDLPDPGDWYPKLETSMDANIDSENRTKLNAEEMKMIVKQLREVAKSV